MEAKTARPDLRPARDAYFEHQLEGDYAFEKVMKAFDRQFNTLDWEVGGSRCCSCMQVDNLFHWGSGRLREMNVVVTIHGPDCDRAFKFRKLANLDQGGCVVA